MSDPHMAPTLSSCETTSLEMNRNATPTNDGAPSPLVGEGWGGGDEFHRIQQTQVAIAPISRRSLLAGGASTLATLSIITPARATPESMEDSIRAALGKTTIKPGRISLEMPALAENGNSVSLLITVDSPMTAADYVKTIFVFAEKNPVVLLHVHQFDGEHVSGTFEFVARHEKWRRLLLALPPLGSRRKSLSCSDRPRLL